MESVFHSAEIKKNKNTNGSDNSMFTIASGSACRRVTWDLEKGKLGEATRSEKCQGNRSESWKWQSTVIVGYSTTATSD